jgi:hypothetical protein
VGVSTSDIGSLDSTIFLVSSNSPKGLCVDIVEVPGLLFSTCQPLALNRLSIVLRQKRPLAENWSDDHGTRACFYPTKRRDNAWPTSDRRGGSAPARLHVTAAQADANDNARSSSSALSCRICLTCPAC